MTRKAMDLLYRKAIEDAGFKVGLPDEVLRDTLAIQAAASVCNASHDEWVRIQLEWPGFANVHLPKAKFGILEDYEARDKEFRRLVWPWWVADQMMSRRNFYEAWKSNMLVNDAPVEALAIKHILPELPPDMVSSTVVVTPRKTVVTTTA